MLKLRSPGQRLPAALKTNNLHTYRRAASERRKQQQQEQEQGATCSQFPVNQRDPSRAPCLVDAYSISFKSELIVFILPAPHRIASRQSYLNSYDVQARLLVLAFSAKIYWQNLQYRLHRDCVEQPQTEAAWPVARPAREKDTVKSEPANGAYEIYDHSSA